MDNKPERSKFSEKSIKVIWLEFKIGNCPYMLGLEKKYNSIKLFKVEKLLVILPVKLIKFFFQKHKTKQNKTKQNKTKQNKTKQNKTKQNKTNKTKQNKTKQNKTKQNKTKQNKTKQNKIKQNKIKK